MTVMGIDPGLDGAVGWVDAESAGADVMPILYGSPDLSQVADFYRSHPHATVFIEEAQAARTAGGAVGSGGFKIGRNYGMLLGQLSERGMAYQVVPASRWKKAMGLEGAGKEGSILMAQRLFPSVDLKRSDRARIYHDGKAESLLLAEYGRRLLSGEKLAGRAAERKGEPI